MVGSERLDGKYTQPSCSCHQCMPQWYMRLSIYTFISNRGTGKVSIRQIGAICTEI